MHRRILITGGAGFVGSSLAVAMRTHRPDTRIVALDNLRRRGSELILARLKTAGVEFRHGDVRNSQDIMEAGPFDLLIDCAAEPSVTAGYAGGVDYVARTNLVGSLNCLEAVRARGAEMVFLSSSRVYPIDPLRALPLETAAERLALPPGGAGPGWSSRGITADFPLTGWRSIYGATKLASELLAIEYAQAFGLRIVIDRCGVIAGPWQMGKVDQGFITLWAARHLYGGRLRYNGFGGYGHQVRDVLHVADLYDLLDIQLRDPGRHSGRVYNVGGGLESSISLAELTMKCRARAGRSIEIAGNPETNSVDVPYYVTDNAAVAAATGWKPSRSIDRVLDDVFDWLRRDESALRALLTEAPPDGAG